MFAMMCVLALAACATAPTVPPADVRVEPSFDASGRMSARHGNDAVAFHFTWRHREDSDDFDVATPLGQTVARMRRDARGIRVERPNEAPVDYRDWSALTAAVLGVPIPVDGLAAWIQASADSARADIERDSAGRPLVLREQGWEIVYAYPGIDAASRPSRLVMRYPGGEPIEVRLVVDRFAPGPTLR
ncbi:MAG: outer membrane lipoprotein LolB [Burkholderiales bacterium]|nr:outer membrane lipoprotein LolB [Burkholderiales bacterium]